MLLFKSESPEFMSSAMLAYFTDRNEGTKVINSLTGQNQTHFMRHFATGEKPRRVNMGYTKTNQSITIAKQNPEQQIRGSFVCR